MQQQTTDYVRDETTGVLLPGANLAATVTARLREKTLSSELKEIKSSIKVLDNKLDAVLQLLQTKLC